MSLVSQSVNFTETVKTRACMFLDRIHTRIEGSIPIREVRVSSHFYLLSRKGTSLLVEPANEKNEN